MAKNLLLEVGTEELPARFLAGALSQLKNLLEESLQEKSLVFESCRTFGTPRRLVAFVTGVAEQQTPLLREIRGPTRQQAYDQDGKPTTAALGFARAHGVAVDQLEVRKTDRGEFVFIVREEKGQPALQVLSEVLPQVIRRLSFPKTMRWEATNFRFGRPIRWIVALLGSEIISFEIAGVVSGRRTFGRRLAGGFKAGLEATLNCADDYWTVVDQLGIVIDPEARKEMVARFAVRLAQSVGGRPEIDEDLLEEVTFLVEAPYGLLGSFDDRFLSLPKVLLKTVMRHHQRYFPVLRYDDAKTLLPHFIVICNGKPEDEEKVLKGNKRVLEARFEDAAFSLAEDQKVPFVDLSLRLRSIVFQEGLGTMADKTQRLMKMMGKLAQRMGLDLGKAIRAAELCKVDLATRLVNEFTELQGWVGGHYARQNGEDEEVAIAVEDHYKPLAPGTALPRNRIGVALAIADRLDTLITCFDRQLMPTGSHDPLGLRRAASTLVQLLAETEPGKHLRLSDLLSDGFQIISEAVLLSDDPQQTRQRLTSFLETRLDTLMEERGIDYDLRRAVLAAGFDNVRAALLRAQALQEERKKNPVTFSDAVTAFTRVTNILFQARQRGESMNDAVNTDLLMEAAETELYQMVTQIAGSFNKQVEEEDFGAAFRTISELAPAINRFFDDVLVMHPEESVRRNRLSLLKRIENCLLQIADFRKIET
ncbi:MAG: glycine--tRNA ligase subunit beta [Armatimonadetes bacterium]|nr:glycine--tRNA ligase subunit beta [Armatimonadota bacterium]MDW8122606.1 glycine--tRNA ligase subunit beta [Armatimonadota bacterium]